MAFLDSSVIIDYFEGIEPVAIEAARLQSELSNDGERLAARDMMVAATARSTGDELVVTDADFQTDVLEAYMSVRNLRT